MKVKLLRTVRNNAGSIMRKGSVVKAEKRYGGYTLTKNKRKKNGCIDCITRVPKDSFKIISK